MFKLNLIRVTILFFLSIIVYFLSYYFLKNNIYNYLDYWVMVNDGLIWFLWWLMLFLFLINIIIFFGKDFWFKDITGDNFGTFIWMFTLFFLIFTPFLAFSNIEKDTLRVWKYSILDNVWYYKTINSEICFYYNPSWLREWKKHKLFCDKDDKNIDYFNKIEKSVLEHKSK